MKTWLKIRAVVDHILVVIGGGVLCSLIGAAYGYYEFYNLRDNMNDLPEKLREKK